MVWSGLTKRRSVVKTAALTGRARKRSSLSGQVLLSGYLGLICIYRDRLSSARRRGIRRPSLKAST